MRMFPWNQRQHVLLCLIGAAILIAMESFIARQLLDSGLPYAEVGDRATRLNFLLILHTLGC